MADELGAFVSYVGGPSYAHYLLPPLEGLAIVEETVVRERAVDSLSKVGAVLPDSSIADHLVPLIKVSAMLSGRLPPYMHTNKASSQLHLTVPTLRRFVTS